MGLFGGWKKSSDAPPSEADAPKEIVQDDPAEMIAPAQEDAAAAATADKALAQQLRLFKEPTPLSPSRHAALKAAMFAMRPASRSHRLRFRRSAPPRSATRSPSPKPRSCPMR